MQAGLHDNHKPLLVVNGCHVRSPFCINFFHHNKGCQAFLCYLCKSRSQIYCGFCLTEEEHTVIVCLFFAGSHPGLYIICSNTDFHENCQIFHYYFLRDKTWFPQDAKCRHRLPKLGTLRCLSFMRYNENPCKSKKICEFHTIV